MNRVLLILLTILWSFSIINPQGLFDEATENDHNTQLDQNFDINGYITTSFISNLNSNELENTITQTGLKLNAFNESGKCYSDFLFQLYDQETSINIREAWIELYFGNLDLRLGSQIIPWGRADGYNPTDNLTPKDFSSFKVDEDSYRVSNTALRGRYYLSKLILEGVIIPKYKYSTVYMETENQENQGIMYALKSTFIYSFIEGSVSWFQGRHLEGGLSGLYTRNASLQKVIGTDLTLTVNNFAIRGEAAYSLTEDYNNSVYTPNPEIEWNIGIDSEISQEITVGVQYIGKWIEDWSELDQKSIASQIKYINRIIWNQTDQMLNSINSIIRLNLFYNTFKLDSLVGFNLTTEELLTRFKVTWNIADSINIYTGINYITGPEGTRADMSEDILNVAFAEVKFTF